MHRDLVVIGCSAGCVRALGSDLLSGLPERFPAATCMVLHTAAESPRVMDDILRAKTPLAVKYAENGEPLRAGSVYIAPPDYHLLIRKGHLDLGRGPRENRHRPAVDPLFRTAAEFHRNRVIGVVLTGNLDDGTRGLMTIKAQGGVAVVQDPADALYPGMPQAALNNVAVDHVVTLRELAPLLLRLTQDELAESPGEQAVGPESIAQSSGFYTCPDCGGPLREINGGKVPYYRCRVGHAYSAESMLQAQRDSVEGSLWAAAVWLQQHAELSRSLAQEAKRAGQKHSALHFETRAKEAERHAEVVKSMLTGSTEQ